MISMHRARKSEATDSAAPAAEEPAPWRNNQLKYFTNIAGYSGVRAKCLN